MMEQKAVLVMDPVTGEVLPEESSLETILADAEKAAMILQQVVAGKPQPVMLNGEPYLEFEDWQTLGRFYRVTTEVEWARYTELDGAKGFEARAVVRSASGQVLSAAESLCTNDEERWQDKPLYQLKSMAQTRACVKALRNLLAWVVVLAGYKPTPAEEMIAAKQEPAPSLVVEDLSKAELRDLFTLAKQAGFVLPVPDEEGRTLVNFQALSRFLKEIGLAGTVKTLLPEERDYARELLRQKACPPQADPKPQTTRNGS